MRLSLTDFRRGLWTVGGKETTMQSFVRRARGMHEIRTPSLRSRNGSFEVATQNGVTAITQMNGFFFFGVGPVLHKDTVGVVYTGTTRDITRFLFAPPQAGLNDSLFFLGDDPKKINTAGVVQNWGIEAPIGSINVADNGAGTMAAGTYRYLVTYKNTTTGSRSNPISASGAVALAANRQARLTTIPVSSDTQVDAREVYRTVANGARFFLVGTINDNVATTFNDNTPDANLQSFEIQYDNVSPTEFDFFDAWVTPDHRVWWLSDQFGTFGNAYYSPPGRPESVRGFVKVGLSTQGLVKGVTWNGANWIFSYTGLYRIFGDDEPFVAVLVDGVPGTTASETITITPYGIAYLSYDGVYLFDGSQARLIGYDEIAPLFRGEDTENLTAITLGNILMYYANNQLFLSGSVGVGVDQTIVFDFRSQTWRDIGFRIKAFWKSPTSSSLHAAFNDHVYVFESPFSTDDDTAGNIELEWEVGGALTDIAHYGTLQRVYVDINTGGNDITVKAIIDGVATTLSTVVNTATRQTVELPVSSNWQARVFSIRLSGSVNTRVELFTLAVDVKLEGGNAEMGVG